MVCDDQYEPGVWTDPWWRDGRVDWQYDWQADWQTDSPYDLQTDWQYDEQIGGTVSWV